jgi:hypothetical protein
LSIGSFANDLVFLPRSREKPIPRPAKALVTVLKEEQPPLRRVAGADAIETAETKAKDLLAQVDAYRELSLSLAVD